MLSDDDDEENRAPDNAFDPLALELSNLKNYRLELRSTILDFAQEKMKAGEEEAEASETSHPDLLQETQQQKQGQVLASAIGDGGAIGSRAPGYPDRGHCHRLAQYVLFLSLS